MAYEVIILGHLHMPLYFIRTFTEYPFIRKWFYEIKSIYVIHRCFFQWALTDSNRRPSACKADALNQLS